jgi:MYXO-CTERM domain-containing protein
VITGLPALLLLGLLFLRRDAVQRRRKMDRAD